MDSGELQDHWSSGFVFPATDRKRKSEALAAVLPSLYAGGFGIRFNDGSGPYTNETKW